MPQTDKPYAIKCKDASPHLLSFVFESAGVKQIEKIIQFEYSFAACGRPVYNLAMGNYNHFGDIIDDEVNSNNGDVYRIKKTVLHAIGKFFNRFPKAAIFLEGSDNTDNFIKSCTQTCYKKCLEFTCKKAGRRIKNYTRYIDQNLEELEWHYQFHGAYNIYDKYDIKDYVPGADYDAVILYQKNV